MAFAGSRLGAAGGIATDGARVAYFTMEVAIDDTLPTFSGGLGVLAGDYLRSAADLGMPLVAVTLLYRKGYFSQRIDSEGRQHEEPVSWDPASSLEPLESEVEVSIGGRPVRVGAWRLLVTGVSGAVVPLYFLDAARPGNALQDQALSDSLYGGDDEYRLGQEVVLGEGGMAMLKALGHDRIEVFHMNEGHSALLTLCLLAEAEQEAPPAESPETPPSDDPGASHGESLGPPLSVGRIAMVRQRTVFTTHTPVPAGHDVFPVELARRTLPGSRMRELEQLGLLEGGSLNMTGLGARLSGYVNAVSRLHRDVAQAMLPGTAVASITNGVHVARWASPAMAELFDRHLGGWRLDSALLRYASSVPLDEIAAAHRSSKQALVSDVRRRTGVALDPDAFTIGLARRVTTYKRATLLFSDPDRLRRLASQLGPLQVVCAGKAHPRDTPGKQLLVELSQAAAALAGAVSVVFVENYGLAAAARLCAGADIWLNTPQALNEASGTSGMKAAVNGVPSLSILDGWWVEGCLEGATGWAIGDGAGPGARLVPAEGADASDAGSLYDRLERVVLPLFWGEPAAFLAVRRSAVALNGSFFSTDRMVREYALAAYRLGERRQLT